jgi:hypothetical protein
MMQAQHDYVFRVFVDFSGFRRGLNQVLLTCGCLTSIPSPFFVCKNNTNPATENSRQVFSHRRERGGSIQPPPEAGRIHEARAVSLTSGVAMRLGFCARGGHSALLTFLSIFQLDLLTLMSYN